MKMIKKICFVLLMIIFLSSCSITSSTPSSVSGGSCFKKPHDLGDCRVKAEQGHVTAQYNLGVMYRDGRGVRKDYVMAHMYFNIAAVSGNKGAIKNRGIVEKDMTSSQIEKAQDLALEWMRTH